MYPAWYDLHKDKEIRKSPLAISVYAYLVSEHPDIFFEPQDIKASTIAAMMEIGRNTVSAALDLLVARGYLIERGRTQYNVRTLLLPQLCQLHSNRAHSSAA